MNPKTFNGIVTSINPPQVTWSKLEKPIPIYFIEYGDNWQVMYNKAMEAYEASKVVRDVENVIYAKWEYGQDKKWWWQEEELPYEVFELKLSMSCQIIETGKNKVKIVKI